MLNLEFDCYEEEDGVSLDPIDWWVNGYPRAGQLFATLALSNLSTFRLQTCTLTEEILISFLRRHATTLKEISLLEVVLDYNSVKPTSWEKTLKQIAPVLFLNSVKLEDLHSDDIENVIIAGDSDDEAYDSRVNAYCQGLTDFLSHRGQTDCPNINDFARPEA